MDKFSKLHSNLDTLSHKQQRAVSKKRIVGQWKAWWEQKLRNNMKLLDLSRKSQKYEDIASLMDSTYTGDIAASVNYQEPKTGYTALHYAVKNQNHGLVNLLLNHHADVKAQDALG